MTTDPPTSDPVAALRDRILANVGEDYPLLGLLVDFEEAIRQQVSAAFAAQVAALRASLKEVLDRIDYINGYDARAVLERARAALAASPEPASPEAPGSGLDVERLARALDPFMTERGQYTGITPDRLAAEYDRLAARPDGAE